MSTISRLFFGFVCIVFGYCLHGWLERYQLDKHPVAETPNFALYRRIAATENLADSLRLRTVYLEGWQLGIEEMRKKPRLKRKKRPANNLQNTQFITQK